MNDESKAFFDDLKALYAKEKREFHWDWDSVGSNPDKEQVLSYLAYNFSKSVIHGPLPDHLHNRMVLASDNEWSKAYVEYLGHSDGE